MPKKQRKPLLGKKHITDHKFLLTLLAITLVGLSVLALNWNLSYKSRASGRNDFRRMFTANQCNNQKQICKADCVNAYGPRQNVGKCRQGCDRSYSNCLKAKQ